MQWVRDARVNAEHERCWWKKREKVLLEKHPHPDSDEGKAYARFWSWVTDYTPFENKKQRGRQVIRHRDLNMVLKHPQPLDSLLQ